MRSIRKLDARVGWLTLGLLGSLAAPLACDIHGRDETGQGGKGGATVVGDGGGTVRDGARVRGDGIAIRDGARVRGDGIAIRDGAPRSDGSGWVGAPDDAGLEDGGVEDDAGPGSDAGQ